MWGIQRPAFHPSPSPPTQFFLFGRSRSCRRRDFSCCCISRHEHHWDRLPRPLPAAPSLTPHKMSEDLAKQLASYKAQLQQVEAALSGNGENEDLLKLKKDLQEVIELTKDLLSTQPSETLASSDSFASTQPTHSWKVGDKCMAIWSEDGQCYEAEIEEIDEENGTAAITFAGYGNAEVTPLLNLKPVEEGRKAKEDSGNKPMSKKEMIAQQREYKKKKALKKAQRIKELEQEREDQKVKWQQFNNRAYSKNKKGQVKRSIFASPESVTGKVGVGTCGIADKPMTQYQDTSKYNVRHLMPQ
ncbi:Survival of motor neuron-related-splicing factor 30 [Manis javanica]|nr:Survival of motor neuron-related-splicing factor 30 [Manis javanica]